VLYVNGLRPGPIQVSYNAPRGETPVVAQWGGNGRDSVAFVSGESWTPRYINCPEEPSNASSAFQFGPKEGWPLAGKWN
jgi:hypothetical protein